MVQKTDLYPGCRVRSLEDNPNYVNDVFTGDCGTVVQVLENYFKVNWDTNDAYVWCCEFDKVELDDDCEDECATDINICDFLFDVAENKT